MTAYPVVFHVGPLAITGFGLLMLAAFLVAGWLAALELRRLGFREDYASEMLGAAVIGGIVGAKLWYVALHGTDALFSRGGLVFYGGLLGGALAVALNSLRLKVPLRWTMHLVASPLAAAYAVGRVGCFLVGDDYGGPTDLPWGVKFPEGFPPSTVASLASMGVRVPAGLDPATVLAVHPTQLYETFSMLLVFAILWPLRRRTDKPVGWLFGLYLVFAGIERFLVEILRAKDDRLLGMFTVAQLTSVLLVVAGAVVMTAWRGNPRVEPGPGLRPA